MVCLNALSNFIMLHGLAKKALHFWAAVLIPSAHLTEHQVIIKKRDFLKGRSTYQPISYTLTRGIHFYLHCTGNFKHHSGKCISKLHNKPHNFLIYLHISCCQGLVVLVLAFYSNTDILKPFKVKLICLLFLKVL